MLPPHDVELGAGLAAVALLCTGWLIARRDKRAAARRRNDAYKRRHSRQEPDTLIEDAPWSGNLQQDAVDMMPLVTWRRQHPELQPPPPYEEPVMVNVNRTPAALIFDGKVVVKGDLLPIGGANSGRQVKVLDPVPNDDGGILVQENYVADPSHLGATLREEEVDLKLTASEAKAVLKFYQAMASGTGVGEATQAQLGPVFDALTQDAKS